MMDSQNDTTSFEDYLTPAEFVDSNHPAIVEFTKTNSHADATQKDNAISLYLATRDQVTYTPYWDFNDKETFRASNCLKTGKGMCQSKAALLAAVCRAANIPSRIGFADVINHLSSQKFLDLLGSNVFRWHAYTDLYIDGKWVKATPSFDAELCKAFNVAPLEFNGNEDSLFQPMNENNQQFMEYIADHGTFADLPHAKIIDQFKIHYAGAMAANAEHHTGSLQDDLKQE